MCFYELDGKYKIDLDLEFVLEDFGKYEDGVSLYEFDGKYKFI